MSEHPLIRKFELSEREKFSKDISEFKPGDTVRVHYRIKDERREGRERLQVFEGVVIAIKHGGNRTTFTVRKVSYGVGVERVFPLYSPHIAKIEVTRRGKVRRAKLYYLRERIGKAAKVKEVLYQQGRPRPEVGKTSDVEKGESGTEDES